MWPQFTIAYVLRSTLFFAIAIWALTWPAKYPHMTGWAVVLVPAAIGGGIGALYGKTPHGVFAGFIAEVVLSASLIVLAIIAHLVNLWQS